MADTQLDVTALYAALDSARKQRQISWREVSRQTDVSASTLSRMAKEHRPDADSVAALTRWLGVPLERFLLSAAGQRTRPARQDTMGAITAALRADRELTEQDATYVEEALRAAYNFVRSTKRGR